MGLFEQEITFDMGHLVLLLALIGFIFFVASRCKLSCGNSKEGLDVPESDGLQMVRPPECKCPSCNEAAFQKAKDGYLYGCDPNNPIAPYSKEECNYQYRKAALHGCGVAGVA
jgi:hypothetical protein